MPDPATPLPASGPVNTSDWMTDIPGGDLPFDDLFSGDGNQPASPAAVAQPQAVTPPAPVPPATTNDTFLKAGNTVYKTREEAERSLAYKDEVVERLRNLEIQRTGIDPLTGKVVPREPQGPVNYTQNPDKYLEDLFNAATKKDPGKYVEAQQRLIFDTLGPLQPVIADFTKQQAVANVCQEIKDFAAFRGSADYTATLEALPELAGAIQLAESDMNFASRLPQLYKTAYWATHGRKTPELVAAAAQAAAVQPATPPTRPTTTTTALPPPAPGAKPSFTTSEGRKAIMAQLEDRVVDQVW